MFSDLVFPNQHKDKILIFKKSFENKAEMKADIKKNAFKYVLPHTKGFYTVLYFGVEKIGLKSFENVLKFDVSKSTYFFKSFLIF